MLDYGIKTYADLARTCGSMVLANEIASRPLDLISGNPTDDEEIFQWYIIQDPDFLMEQMSGSTMRRIISAAERRQCAR